MGVRSTRAAPPEPHRIALLVVHGIGAQTPGETVAKLWDSLIAVLPPGEADVRADTLECAWGGRVVKCYEVHWAPHLAGEAVKRTFRPDMLRQLAWLPFFNKRRACYSHHGYTWPLVIGWSILLVPLGLATFVIYWGAKLLSGLTVRASSGEAAPPPEPRQASRPFGKDAPLARRWLDRSLRAARSGRERYLLADSIADDYLGDVFTYVASAGGALPAGSPLAGSAETIRGEVHRALRRAQEDGCDEVQIVAHSLGTVVTFHALVEFGAAADPLARQAIGKLTVLHTIGSPLEKIRFLWPTLVPSGGDSTPRFSSTVWHNFYNPLDPVAGRLVHYDGVAPVSNHRVRGGAGLIRAHVVYERNPQFLALLTQGLLGVAFTPPRPGVATRVRSWLAGWLENLAAPAAVLLLLAAGVALMAGTVVLPGFLLTLPLRPFVDAATIHSVQNWLGWFFGGTFLLTFIVSGPLGASEGHRGYSTCSPPPGPPPPSAAAPVPPGDSKG